MIERFRLLRYRRRVEHARVKFEYIMEIHLQVERENADSEVRSTYSEFLDRAMLFGPHRRKITFIEALSDFM
jgi:hypothetical protein